MIKLITTFFYVGLLPKAPGTWGSLAALPFALIIFAIGSFPALLAATIIAFCAGWWATMKHTENSDNHDPGEIVIDEVVGQWITLLPLAGMLWSWEVPIVILPWPGLVAGLMFFRFFDIIKPWPISWADGIKTPFGVMFDDVLAGIMAAATITILGALAHGYI